MFLDNLMAAFTSPIAASSVLKIFLKKLKFFFLEKINIFFIFSNYFDVKNIFLKNKKYYFNIF
jgi:hypothetical protein